MQNNAPTQITAGDTLDFLLHIPSHPSSAGWYLEFNLVPRMEGSALILSGEPQGDAYRVQAGPGTTGAVLYTGPYDWVAWVNGNGQSHTVARGHMQVLPNPRNATRGLDSRSLAQRTLDDLLIAKARWDVGTGNQHRYRINEREMEFKSAAELERLIRFWEYRVYRESKPSSRFYLQAL
jgi:hypothetical protein